MVKKRACIFISGSGTNLNSIIKNSRDYNFPINVNLVISNNKSAKGIGFAKKFSIPYIFLDSEKDRFEKIAIKELLGRKIELVCLAGFMKILSKSFVRNFKGKIINIHPSLLPKYKGLNTHKRALINNEKEAGCTVHYVSSKLDSGKIISQSKVKIIGNETEKTLSLKVLKKEHILYPRAIKKVILSFY